MNTHDKCELPPVPSAYNDSDGYVGYSKSDLKAYARAAIELYRQGGNAKHQYEKAIEGSEELDPIERLRFFCSIAMRAQDWLDVEPLFEDLIADRQRRGEPVAWFVDWPDEPDLGHYLAEAPADGARNRALVFSEIAPQPAEPVKHPSYDSDCCQGHKSESECKCAAYDAEPVKVPSDLDFDGWAEDIARLGYDGNVEDVELKLREFYARYGAQPASGHSAAPMDTSPGHSGQPTASAEPVGEVFRHGEGRDQNGPRVGLRMLPAGETLPHGTKVFAAPVTAQPKPSGHAGKLDYRVTAALARLDALLDPASGLLSISAESATASASRADLETVRAALAAQPHLYDGDTLTAAYMAGQDSVRVTTPASDTPVTEQEEEEWQRRERG